MLRLSYSIVIVASYLLQTEAASPSVGVYRTGALGDEFVPLGRYAGEQIDHGIQGVRNGAHYVYTGARDGVHATGDTLAGASAQISSRIPRNEKISPEAADTVGHLVVGAGAATVIATPFVVADQLKEQREREQRQWSQAPTSLVHHHFRH